MVADFGPSFSLTPQAFSPTTWRLGGGAGESAACREGMRESVRFIAPTGRGGTAAPAPVPFVMSVYVCVVCLYCRVCVGCVFFLSACFWFFSCNVVLASFIPTAA